MCEETVQATTQTSTETEIGAANRRFLEMLKTSGRAMIGPIGTVAAIVAFCLNALPEAHEIPKLEVAYVTVLKLMLALFASLIFGWFAFVFLWISGDQKRTSTVAVARRDSAKDRMLCKLYWWMENKLDQLANQSAGILYFLFALLTLGAVVYSVIISAELIVQLYHLIES